MKPLIFVYSNIIQYENVAFVLQSNTKLNISPKCCKTEQEKENRIRN